MRFTQLIFVLNVFLLKELDAQTLEKNDHLICYGVKDSEKISIKRMNMQANKVQSEYGTTRCRINKQGAIRFCVPATKIVKKGTHDPSLGGLVPKYDPNRCIQNDLLCYKMKCKKPFPTEKTQMVKDQFGTTGARKLTLKNTIEICTPAWKMDENGDIVLNDLCPTPATDKPSSCSPTIAPSIKTCDQTPACVSKNGGQCVKKDSCISGPFLDCNDSLCDKSEGCTCKKPKCYQEANDECSMRRGKCIKKCDENPFVECLDICKNEDPNNEDKCKCAIEKTDCKQKKECVDVNGKCIRKSDCVPSLFQECDGSLCNTEEDCTCLKPKCYQEQDDDCSNAGGRCIKNCEKAIDSNQNLECKDICKNPNNTIGEDKCKCLVQNPPCKQMDVCTKAKGKCIPKNTCIPTPLIECDDSLCKEGGEGCTCMKPVDKECRQKDDCTKARGKCIPEADCVISPFQDCDNSLCFGEDGCTCAKPKCYQDLSDPCTKKKGRCIKDCRGIISNQPELKCEDICRNDPNSEDKCECLFKDAACEQKSDCTDAKGSCVSKNLCTPTPFNDCDDSLCDKEDGCTCKKPVDKICTQQQECADVEGKCITKSDCVPSLLQECDDSLCVESEDCTCLKPKCYQADDDECSKNLGTCIKNCKLVSSQVPDTRCLNICTNDDQNQNNRCECLVKRPPCNQTPECTEAEGECTPKELCIPSPFFDCDHSLCDKSKGCTCKKPKCYQTKGDKCSQEGGRCIKDCAPTSILDCLDVCKNEDPNSKVRCKCAVRKSTCPQIDGDQCTMAGGKCIKNCTPSLTLSCKNICLNFSTGNNEPECMCAVPINTDVPCTQSRTGVCTTKYSGTCKKNCVDNKSTGCADVCKRLDGGTSVNRCFCEYKKTPVGCSQTKLCDAKNGECVSKKDCETSKTVSCDDKLCSILSPAECTCKITTKLDA